MHTVYIFIPFFGILSFFFARSHPYIVSWMISFWLNEVFLKFEGIIDFYLFFLINLYLYMSIELSYLQWHGGSSSLHVSWSQGGAGILAGTSLRTRNDHGHHLSFVNSSGPNLEQTSRIKGHVSPEKSTSGVKPVRDAFIHNLYKSGGKRQGGARAAPGHFSTTW